ncbi:MAG: PhzF family phenazine biosynthesis protein [Marinilabiliaceae bacterium]
MKIQVYQVDAFTDHIFGGNPAAVVPLDEWLPDDVMQNIARENNLSETAFFVEEGAGYRIRWFTPTVEVNLCGHATLSAAHVLFIHLAFQGDLIRFFSASGDLSVARKGDVYLLDFPADMPRPVPKENLLLDCFDRGPSDVLKGTADYLMVFDDADYVRDVIPNLDTIEMLDAEGVIITAPGTDDADFVSRFFAPQLGIPEDPVTGSAHTLLVPYWSGRLGKKELFARQVSQRGGDLWCQMENNRTLIGGRAVTYLRGEIELIL